MTQGYPRPLWWTDSNGNGQTYDPAVKAELEKRKAMGDADRARRAACQAEINEREGRER